MQIALFGLCHCAVYLMDDTVQSYLGSTLKKMHRKKQAAANWFRSSGFQLSFLLRPCLKSVTRWFIVLWSKKINNKSFFVEGMVLFSRKLGEFWYRSLFFHKKNWKLWKKTKNENYLEKYLQFFQSIFSINAIFHDFLKKMS